ncbi:ubiquitin-like domain-containing protein [Siminovitchia sediminis]|uniref:Ubiquitin-like domain-containing protein n=1 Tax=Siminovitchia sediminis TaxID=1274353 RepID=A0ABW4KJR0_9BACI
MGTEMRSRRKLGLAVASLLVFTATLMVLITEGTKKTVALTLDGEELVIKTHADTIGEMLNELDVDVKETDYLSHDPSTAVKDQLSLIWEPAKPVILTDGDESKKVLTTASTVRQLFHEESIELSKHDQINVSLNEKVVENMTIDIERAFEVVLNNGKNQEKVWTTSTTVADFLQQQGVELGDLDQVKPELDKELVPGKSVDVIRVEKVSDVVEEPVDFKVVTKQDGNLEKGTEKVIQEGQKGLLKKKYEVTKENGKVVKRSLVSEEEIKESTAKIVAVGTKAAPAPADSSKPQSAVAKVSSPQKAKAGGGKEVYMDATAYTADCNGCSGITATGINLKANPNAKVVAVDPNVIPLGSKVWVEGYGYAVAGDTGGAIKGNRIDVHVGSKGQAYNFGKKRVKVRIVD